MTRSWTRWYRRRPYFNPHFRKGSDRAALDNDMTVAISIHTSAREVTHLFRFTGQTFMISIHTSAREVTHPDDYFYNFPVYFNPHFRKGSDDLLQFPLSSSVNFNPHFRKGSDSRQWPHYHNPYYFNPHFRKGSDSAFLWLTGNNCISIHTSAREVTALFISLHISKMISIHTSAREVTLLSFDVTS